MPFWAASSIPSALLRFVEHARDEFPFLVALCLQEPAKLPMAIRDHVATTAQRYTNPDKYNSDIAERYAAFACWEHGHGDSSRFNVLIRQVFDLLSHEEQAKQQGKKNRAEIAPTETPVASASPGEDLVRCIILSIDTEMAHEIAPFLLKYKRLRKHGSWAPEPLLSAFEKMLYSGTVSVHEDSRATSDLSATSKMDILDSIIGIGTVAAFELMCSLLYKMRFSAHAAAALTPVFSTTDESRRGFQIECDSAATDNEFGWLWRPFLRSDPPDTLAVNTTTFIKVLLKNLEQGFMATRNLPTRIGAGLLAVYSGPMLVRLCQSDPSLRDDIKRFVERYTFSATDNEKGDAYGRLNDRIKPLHRGFVTLGAHVKPEVMMEVAFRLAQTDEEPTAALWGNNIVKHNRPTLTEIEEYALIPVSSHVGTAIGLFSVAAGFVFGGNWIIGLAIAFYLCLSWWLFARDPARFLDENPDFGSIPIFAVPGVGLPFLIVNVAVARVELLHGILSTIFKVRTSAMKLLEIWFMKADLHVVWVASVCAAIWFGLSQILPSDIAIATAFMLVLAGIVFQIGQFGKAWQRFVSFDSSLSGLMSTDGELLLALRLH